MKGYIGFFDILGYQSFLKNNSDEAVQDQVLDFLNRKEDPGTEHYKEVFPGMAGTEVEKLVRDAFSKIKRLVFSDTIVFTLEVPAKDKDFEAIYCLIVLGVARFIMTKMFDYGLPLRGALHYGEYKYSGHSMAGKGVVEAYEYGGKLNLSTCVLTQSMYNRFLDIAKENTLVKETFNSQVVRYQTPLSSGVRELRYNLKSESVNYTGAKDLREFVYKKFWAHGKDFENMHAVEKVEETERFILYCMVRNEEQREHYARKMVRVVKNI